MLNTHLFKDFHFLLFDSESLTQENLDNNYNFIINNKTILIYSLIENYLNLYFYHRLFDIPFDNRWNDFIKIIKTYHIIKNNNVIIEKYLKYLNKKNLNNFIINFIKEGFILKKNSIDITNNIELWQSADKIIPNNLFKHDKTLFNAYNINYEFKNIFPKINTNDNFLIFLDDLFKNNIFYYLQKNDAELFQSDLILDLYNKFEKTINNYIELQTKIDMMQKIIEDNIKSNKIITFKEMADLIEENNFNKRTILKEKQNIQNGLFFIINKKNNNYF